MHVLALRSRARSFYWLINPKKFREEKKVIHRFVDYYVDKALRYTTSSDGDIKAPNDKGRYIFLEALARETRDRKALRDQLLNILIAGRDTTSSLLSSVFYFLARHPAVFHNLRREILDRFGEHGEKEEINFSSLKDLQYLRHVINESKLHPLVPVRNVLNHVNCVVSYSPATPSTSAIERAFRCKGYHSPRWRWSRRPLSGVYPEGPERRIHRVDFTPTPRHLGRRCGRVPPGEVARVHPEGMGVYPLQRRSADLSRT